MNCDLYNRVTKDPHHQSHRARMLNIAVAVARDVSCHPVKSGLWSSCGILQALPLWGSIFYGVYLGWMDVPKPETGVETAVETPR